MKVLTLNFVTCAVKACKSSSTSYPLHPKDAELVQDEIELNPQLLINVLPRLDWSALRTTSTEVGRPPVLIWETHGIESVSLIFVFKLGFPELPVEAPTPEALEEDEKLLKELHNLLLETQISSGKLVCGNCGHEYAVREGIANFLLPSHLV
jgi:multifunctional methyltransferase subunit TRM112